MQRPECISVEFTDRLGLSAVSRPARVCRQFRDLPRSVGIFKDLPKVCRQFRDLAAPVCRHFKDLPGSVVSLQTRSVCRQFQDLPGSVGHLKTCPGLSAF